MATAPAHPLTSVETWMQRAVVQQVSGLRVTTARASQASPERPSVSLGAPEVSHATEPPRGEGGGEGKGHGSGNGANGSVEDSPQYGRPLGLRIFALEVRIVCTNNRTVLRMRV